MAVRVRAGQDVSSKKLPESDQALCYQSAASRPAASISPGATE